MGLDLWKCVLSSNSHVIHVRLCARCIAMVLVSLEWHADITRVGPWRKKEKRKKEKIPTIFKCLPLICLLINGPVNSNITISRYPSTKMLLSLFMRKKESSVLVKKKKKYLLSCHRVYFFLIEKVVRSIHSLRNVKIPLFLEFVKQHVYANRVIFLWMKKWNVNGFIL